MPKFKNTQEYTEAEERRRTFILDTGQDHGNTLFSRPMFVSAVSHFGL